MANAPMTEMSLRADDREFGVRWLRDRGHHTYTSESSFPPRWLVGQYLQDCATKAIERLEAAGSRVRTEMLTVSGLESHNKKLWLGCNEWPRGPFDHTILCLGTSASHDPYQLSGLPGYIENPYPLRSSLAEIPPDARVAIIGSGLSAVDTVMALRARAHRGLVTLISRNGSLPAVRGASVSHAYQYLTTNQAEAIADREGRLRLEDIIGLLKSELDSAGIDINSLADGFDNSGSPILQLQSELDRARKGDPAWTLARNGLVGCGKDLWHLLRDEDKDAVKSYHQAFMRFYRPMPPSTGEHLLELFNSGQLDLISGATSIRATKDTGAGFEILAARNISADIVIEAAAFDTHEPSPLARPIIDALIAQGLASPHPFGGLRVERKTARLLNANGTPDSRLHALGDLTSGDYLFTFGIISLVAHADSLVRDIAASVKSASEAPGIAATQFPNAMTRQG